MLNEIGWQVDVRGQHVHLPVELILPRVEGVGRLGTKGRPYIVITGGLDIDAFIAAPVGGCGGGNTLQERKVAMSLSRLPALGIVVVLCCTYQEAAGGVFTVKNVTTGEIIFEDDGFEDDAVGAIAPNSPAIGSYAQGATGKTIVDDPVPGPYDGTNYFKHTRVNSPTDYQYVKFAPFGGVPNGEELEATFAVNVNPGSTADFTLFYGGNIPVAQILAFGGQAQPWRLAAAPAYVNEFPPLADAGGAWREVTINFSTTLFRLTVDGVSYDYAGAIDPAGVGAPSIDRIVLNPSSAGATYYIDAIPSPPSLSADFDLDEDVDATDLSIWQTNFPIESNATHAQGDADGDGTVDGADFLVWQRELNITPPINAVPEPSSFLTLVIGSILILPIRQRSFSCRCSRRED